MIAISKSSLRLAGLVASSLWMSTLAFASESPLSALKSCKPEIEKVLKEWGSLNEWKKQPYDADRFVHYTPTQAIGTWIELKAGSDSEVSVSRMESTDAVVMKYASANCKPEITVLPRKVRGAGSYLTDEKLAEVLTKEKKGFVYIWSPHMPLSIEGVENIRAAAKELNVALTVLLDPNADLKAAQRIAREKKWPSDYTQLSASYEVNFRGMLHHYPALMTYKDSKPQAPVIPGLRSPAYYQAEGRRQGL